MSKKDESTLSISTATLRYDMHILSSSYQPFITITDDGRVAIADHLTVDEAAREFWNAVLRLNPLLLRPAPAAQIGDEACRHIRATVHATEIWSGGARLAVATSYAIANEIAEALNGRSTATRAEPAMTEALLEFAEAIANDPDEHTETRARAREAIEAARASVAKPV
ncbi:hypothetical protein KTE28_23960 [Burkholderia multivorans]|uniref:hypothetical protein n=1 Tax=Burkholderia multivorans TaxID=87883 RepID=UPI001C257298|nr:hypothetical protein [Burkholderia multivorans]MBU9377390.1 hypothetical protein [Burkholderia multivorans]